MLYRQFTYRGESNPDTITLFSKIIRQNGIGPERVQESGVCYTGFPEVAAQYCSRAGSGIWLFRGLPPADQEGVIEGLIPLQNAAYFLTSPRNAKTLYRQFGNLGDGIFGRPLEEVVLSVEHGPPVKLPSDLHKSTRQHSLYLRDMMGKIEELSKSNTGILIS